MYGLQNLYIQKVESPVSAVSQVRRFLYTEIIVKAFRAFLFFRVDVD